MSSLGNNTWEQTFQALIQEETPRVKWSLKLDNEITPDRVPVGWNRFQQNAFARFSCSMCHRRWTSVQVKVLCHLYLEAWTSKGQVLMRIFAQRCQKCSSSKFEDPEISKESMMEILEALVQYILQRYFGHEVKKRPVNREGHVGGPHDAGNCEACTLGHCAKGSVRNKAKPSKPPYPPPEIPPGCRNDLLLKEPRDSGSLVKELLVFGATILVALILGKMT